MSDDEDQINPREHKKLLQSISNLGKSQHIRKTTRNEPLRQQDEFQLVKPADEARTRHPVGLLDIVNVLKTTKRHIDAGKKFKSVQSTKKVLGKPLEKPQADRLKRGLGYEKTVNSLGRWDAVVTQNRNAETQVFPLPSETIYINTTMRQKPLKRAIKSDLARELEAERARLRAAKRALAGETENEADLAKREEELLKKKLTRDELIERRRELKYLKIRESQKSLKARKQNKIKSKKYHKLLKKQKVQEQIKQFEILQKTDPEAALAKLNEFEKNRVLERASLRHKNTGTWAKNLQMRAKYDKDVRKDLAEQLHISRQLTQKKHDSDDDSEDEAKAKQMEVEKELADSDPFNPWTRVGNGKKSKQVEEDKGDNWRKYWLERNENEKLLHEYKKSLQDEDKENGEEVENADSIKAEEDVEIKSITEEETIAKSAEIVSSEKVNKKKVKVEKQINVEAKNKGMQSIKKKVKLEYKDGNVEGIETSKKVSKQKLKLEKQEIKKKNKKLKKVKTESEKKNVVGEWRVEDIKPTNQDNIDDIFDRQEDKIKAKLNRKLKRLSTKSKQIQRAQLKDKNKKSLKEKDALENFKELSFKTNEKRPIIDEELNNGDNESEPNPEMNLENSDVVKVSDGDKVTQSVNAGQTTKKSTENQPTDTIDPNKLAEVKLKQHVNNFIGLNETIGDEDADMSGDDDDMEKSQLAQQMTITEAFEDDDIVADFTRDKAKDTELKDAEIDLFMPGWGSWAGAGISAEKQNSNKNKRLVLKLAEKEERRDDNKGDLYINETPSKQLRTHLVSSVPFPFTSVAEYESSISATIGRNCVPETAFRMLTRPAVIVRKGQITEPMDETELVKPQRRLNNIVDIRILQMNKEKAREEAQREKIKEEKQNEKFKEEKQKKKIKV